MTYEVEVKFPVSNLDVTRERMESLGARFERTERQVDTYLSHPIRNFAETDEAFRIRSIGDSNCFTYKGPIVDTLSKMRKEIEFGIDSGKDAFDQASEMVSCLGFEVVRTVEKERTYLLLNFKERVMELTLDEVSGLGTYVEIETLAEESDREAARDAVLALADELGLSGQERRSYLCLLIEAEATSGP